MMQGEAGQQGSFDIVRGGLKACGLCTFQVLFVIIFLTYILYNNGNHGFSFQKCHVEFITLENLYNTIYAKTKKLSKCIIIQ